MATMTQRTDTRETDGGLDDDAAWAAVQGRDAAYDGRLVYAVASTGIYCRPSCPSRRPRRERVAFFRTPEEAEGAGFRECRRCRPRAERPSGAETSVRRAREYLDAHLDETVTLERLGRAAMMSPTHLQRVFKRATGMSPREYVAARRAERLKARLREGDTVSRATFEAGYGSASRVYEQAAPRLGMTPAAYRRGGRGERIRFATAATPLGRLMLAATERGVCAVTLGDGDAELEAALRREFPGARLERADDTELEGWIAMVARHLEGAQPELSLPLDVRATAFQWQVWKALREIPYGGTRSYGQVAAALGRPTAARAVARACASNPVALVVPCHRVVREDGAAGGYRWGMERKEALLRREREQADHPHPGHPHPAS